MTYRDGWFWVDTPKAKHAWQTALLATWNAVAYLVLWLWRMVVCGRILGHRWRTFRLWPPDAQHLQCLRCGYVPEYGWMQEGPRLPRAEAKHRARIAAMLKEPPNRSETPNTISGGRSTERMPASRWENAEENRATPELRELIEATNERFRQARASACSVDRRVWQAVYTAWREAVPFSEPSAGEAADRELRTLLRGEAP